MTFLFFFFNDTATTEIYTLSLHDALPISSRRKGLSSRWSCASGAIGSRSWPERDRKSTRLNSSHGYISYAVFCLKKKKKTKMIQENLDSTHTPDSAPPVIHITAVRIPEIA